MTNWQYIEDENRPTRKFLPTIIFNTLLSIDECSLYSARVCVCACVRGWGKNIQKTWLIKLSWYVGCHSWISALLFTASQSDRNLLLGSFIYCMLRRRLQYQLPFIDVRSDTGHIKLGHSTGHSHGRSPTAKLSSSDSVNTESVSIVNQADCIVVVVNHRHFLSSCILYSVPFTDILTVEYLSHLKEVWRASHAAMCSSRTVFASSCLSAWTLAYIIMCMPNRLFRWKNLGLHKWAL